jgi:hypothetical protein
VEGHQLAAQPLARRLGRPAGLTAERVALGALALACAAVFVAAPLTPTYDLAHQLLWGRDLAGLRLPELDAYRAPTQHPLAIAVGVLLAPLGAAGPRIAVALVLAAYVALVAGVMRLGRAAFTPLVGAAAALLVVTRLDYASLAVRSYVDVPYLALVVWAATLEARSPRRGGPVWALLIAAGLLRPEAWALAGAYGVWVGLGSGGRRPWRAPRALARALGLAAAAPLTWALSDLLLTGSPLFSLTYTSGSAAELGRQGSVRAVPSLTVHYLETLLKPPGLVAGAAGLAAALWLVPRRAAVPALLAAAGVVTFAAIVGAGLAVIARYLAVTGLALLVFAGFAVAGWTALRSGRLRRAWQAGALAAVAGAAAFSATHTSPATIVHDLETRSEVPSRLHDILSRPAVAAARRCGPVIVPNQKLFAEVRLAVHGLRARDVLARSDLRSRPRQRRGVAIVPANRRVLEHPAYRLYETAAEPADIAVPPPGFTRLATNGWFAAYGRC